MSNIFSFIAGMAFGEIALVVILALISGGKRK